MTKQHTASLLALLHNPVTAPALSISVNLHRDVLPRLQKVRAVTKDNASYPSTKSSVRHEWQINVQRQSTDEKQETCCANFRLQEFLPLQSRVLISLRLSHLNPDLRAKNFFYHFR